MEPQELFEQVINLVGPCIRQVQDAQLANPTPCNDWDLRALLRHIVYELMWMPEIIDSKTIAEVGDRFEGDILGTDITAAWDRASHGALAAVETAKLKATAHLSYGDFPVSHYIAETAGDILIHGWDVNQSIKCNLLIPDDLAQVVYDSILPRTDEFAASGLFGTPVDAPEDATIQIKLLALVGRKAAQD